MNSRNIEIPQQKSPEEDIGVGIHPKNHYRYCPRCSKEGTFNVDEFSFKCQSCGFNFFINSSAAVTALIFDNSGAILMTRRGVEPSIGMLDLPGGFIDPGENVEEALFRELKEELDIIPDKIEYYGSFPNEYQFSGTIVYTIDMAFKCTVNDFSKLKFRDDIIGIEFKKLSGVDKKEVPFRSVQNILKKLQNEQ